MYITGKVLYFYQESIFCDVEFYGIPRARAILIRVRYFYFRISCHSAVPSINVKSVGFCVKKLSIYGCILVTWTVSNGVKVGLNSVTGNWWETGWAQLFIGKCVTFESSDLLMTVAGTL